MPKTDAHDLLVDMTRRAIRAAGAARPPRCVVHVGAWDHDLLGHLPMRGVRVATPDDARPELQALDVADRDDVLWVWTGDFPGSSPWADLIGRHGLVVAQTVDAGRAEAILMASAARRLFPRDCGHAAPAWTVAGELLLAHWEQRGYAIRVAAPSDLPELMTLEQRCWAPALRASSDAIEARLRRYAAGQLVLELDGVVCGVIYAQRIRTLDELEGTSSEHVGRLHVDVAPILQLLAVNIRPESQHMNLGDQLLEFMLQRAALMPGVESAAAVTLCRRYARHRREDIHDYIRRRTRQGKLSDPILRFHELHGATIQRPIANYRPLDSDNAGYGVLVTYDLARRRRDETLVAQVGVAGPPADAPRPEQVERRVEALITDSLGSGRETAFERARPLMEMGLTSADLIGLGEALRAEYGLSLETTFFFECNTPEKIVQRLCRLLGAAPGGAAPVEDAPERAAVPGPRARAADVAIVGIGCRLPGGIASPRELWRFLLEGQDAITTLPPDRWTWPDEIDPVRRHPGIDRGGFLADVARFDARFFRVAPREAELMDPQQRLLLELTWETLEDAAWPPSALMGTNTGVFVGASGSDYNVLLQSALGPVDAHVGTGGAFALLANRISYFYGLQGPSVSLDTACSSSLVAVHQALRSLRGGECDQALVAGVNVMCHPATTIAFYKSGMLAPDGRCKTFDRAANGYVRAEGGLAVLLKPLARAEADRDFIYAVIKGSAVNHGGQASGLTAPNPERQAALLLAACRDADVPLGSLGYLEAHGTGTSLGDPVEVTAIRAALGATNGDGARAARCGLGSIKTNLGHLEAAAGLAGLVKAALSLRHAWLPKHLNVEELNPRLDLADTPLFLVRESSQWERPDAGPPRRAGVSSFGSGGTNAHVVLEEHPRRPSPLEPCAPGPWLFVLSAQTPERLRAHAARLAAHLRADDPALSALAWTLQTGREALEARLALIASTRDELVAALDGYCAGAPGVQGLHAGQATRHAEADASDALERRDLAALAALWTQGVSLPWVRLHDGPRPERCALPTYPFAEDRYWIAGERAAPPRATPAEWIDVLRLERADRRIGEHVVEGRVILPGVTHLEVARALGERRLGRKVRSLRNVIWGRPLIVDAESREVEVVLRPDAKGASFELRSREDRAVVFSRGALGGAQPETGAPAGPATHDLDAIRARASKRIGKQEMFAHFDRIGLRYGPTFQAADELWAGETEALVRLVPGDEREDERACVWSPPLMDSAIRTSFLIGLGLGRYDDRLRIPFSLGRLDAFASLDRARYAYARVAREGPDGDYVSHVSVLDEQGVELLLFEDFLARAARPADARRARETGRPPSEAAAVGEADAHADALFARTVAYLKDTVAAATKTPAHGIAAREPLGSYGIDSVMIMEMNKALEADFDSLPGTLFFQFGTLHDLAGYFIANHAERLRARLGAEPVPAEATSRSPTPARRSAPAARAPLPAPREGGADIAIIGISGRYPKADSPDRLWENLKAGVDAIEEIPPERWDYRQYYRPNGKQPGTTNSKWGGFIDRVDSFDAAFFHISPREATYMDPQQRLFLEVAWSVCEDAGYSWERTRNAAELPLQNNVGVFVGLMYDDYHFFERQISTSYWNSFVANRVSHFFNFRGPSMTVDTACSSSLTSVYMACESLRRGHCYAAIAGGTNLSIHPRKYARLTQLNMLSSDGRCRSFGRGGNGYVPGEGVGAVLLKRLDDALRDRDHVYAVIKGGALNHGGRTNGFTVPNPNAQAELVLAALADSGVSPRSISYVEAHGTGTELGDPIEISGLTQAFRRSTGERQFCRIGSLKSNIGHLEGAAGIAALTKVVLQLRHRQLAPSLHAQVTNPLIDFGSSPFTLVQELTEWPRPVIEEDGASREYPRRAGISSFGAGGANAHLVLEEHEAPEDDAHGELPALVPLSARTEERLKAYVRALLAFCQAPRAEALDVARMAYTLQTGRQAMEWRVAFVAGDARELCDLLTAFLAGQDTDRCYRDQVRRGAELAGAFGADEDLQEAVEKWIARRKWERIAQLWVKGLEVDWTKVYGDRAPRRMPLPTYPFDGERYWVPASNEAEALAPVIAAAAPTTGPDLVTFREAWLPAPPPPPAPSSARVVYFATEQHPAESFALALQAQGVDALVVGVERGETFARLDRLRYRLRASEPADYRQLLEQLEGEGWRQYVIVHRWGEGRGLDGIRALRDLIAGVGPRPAAFRLVVTGALGDDLAGCFDASWIGYERSLKILAPALALTLLYSDGAPLDADVVARESWQPGVVRYRAGVRQRLTVADAPVDDERAPALRHNGVYLVTGGCGGLGALFAEHLAQRHKARLALLGRRAEDERIRRQLDRLTSLGAAEVAYYAADVSDGAALRAAVEDVRARFERIDGIIHAAGVGPAGSVFDKPWSECEAVLRPKLAGTINLDHATADVDLDFVCYFSSSSAVFGDFGSCDYAAGNRFQMAFGALRRRRTPRRGRTVVVNWPLWREGGMTIGDPAQTEMYLKTSGQRYLERDEGVRLWERLAAGDDETLVLAGEPGRLRRSLARVYGLAETPGAPAVAPAQAAALGRADGVGAEQAPEERVAGDVRASVARILAVPEERLDDEAAWADFGFDSITLGELGKALSERFGVEIPPSLFFSYSTIKQLSSHLVREGGVSPEPAESARPVARASADDGAIAIIGLAGRFPGAADPEQLWRLLVSGQSALTEVPPERWDWRDYYFGAGDARNKIASNRGGFVDDVALFDPLFFGIAPREAEAMEPKQRLLLHEAWHALEDAGYAGARLRGSDCGVFVGVEEGDHAFLAGRGGLTPGNHNAVLAARISYCLDLRGPNLAVNTACSSGLVALHLACQSLRAGECGMALAGAINLLLSPAAYLMLSEMNLLARDGESRPFDRRASGMVPGEALGVVVLKPLARAVADRDHVYAVIKGSGTNYDGRTNGITAPNALSQAALVEDVLARACVDPARLQLVVAHSTGSPLGDPLEVQALSRALRGRGAARQACALASVKPAIGHSFAASGIVNVIALCLAMEHRTLPGLRCEQPNPQLDVQSGPFSLNAEPTPWRSDAAGARLGLVAATGMSGTNAVVVLEQPPAPSGDPARAADAPARDALVVLSAATTGAVEESVRRLRAFLAAHPDVDLGDVAYSLQVGRDALTHRVAFLARDTATLATMLDGFVWPGAARGRCSTGEIKKRQRTTLSAQDAALQEAVRAWRERGDGEQLVRLWVKGADFDWNLLYDVAQPRRIPLPTYPFARRPFGAAPGASSVPGRAKRSKRVCVVGAGPSGLVMAKSLLEEGHEPVVHERQDALGGLWILREDKAAGVYRNTRFQTSKYTSVFSDFVTDDIGSTFYSVGEVKSYLDRYARQFELRRLIRYGSQVVSVRASGDRWAVSVSQGGAEREEEFDGVAMCHGMFWKPHLPAVPGLASFPGVWLHAGRYYDNRLFRGKRVLVIGNGVSGMDVAEEASEVAERVFWSLRSLKLILPRMVGFVPNDCQSIASLLLPANGARQLERLRRAMPEYAERYERSGLWPTPQDVERSPTVLINDNVVRLVDEGRIQVCSAASQVEGASWRFADGTSVEVDVVVFCTGYESGVCDYVPGIRADDFAMGTFYRRNPTLVNPLGLLPIAYSGTFLYTEMAARWYAQVLSGAYRLSQAELQHCISARERVVIGPLATLLCGLKLGVFPSPEREFSEFWRLLNHPSFPVMYRLRGVHRQAQAARLLEEFRKRAFVRTADRDPEIKTLKHRLLAGLGASVVERLLTAGEITPDDRRGALAERDRALRLDWDLQYVRDRAALPETLPAEAQHA